MKKSVLFLLGLFLMCVGQAQIARDTIILISLQEHGRDLILSGISFNGQYVTGQTDFDYSTILWNESTGLVEIGNDGYPSRGVAVSNNGIIAGKFYDPNYKYEDENGDSILLFMGGYYNNGMWHSLRLNPNIPILSETVSHADAISADGTIIGGSQFPHLVRPIPTKWENALPTELPFINTGNGARILCLSGDGSIAGGWSSPNGTDFPVLWINGEMHQIYYNGTAFTGVVNHISNNGKYAALYFNDRPAIYDIESQEITIIDKKEGALVAEAIAVSDNGILLGTNLMRPPLGNDAFIYLPQRGMMDLTDYLDSLGIILPNGLEITNPVDISADGSRIIGNGRYNDYGIGWLIYIENHLEGVNRPGNIRWVENSQGNITLTWLPAEADPGHTFTGYNLYRNGVKLNTTPITVTNYQDVSIPAGKYTYYVTAVWGSEESLPSTSTSYNLGILGIPFLENFSTGSLGTHYWNQTPRMNTWNISLMDGLVPPALEFAVPVNSYYADTITSAYFQGNQHPEIFLSFNISRPLMGDITGDTMKLEIFNGNTWQLLKEYYPKRSGNLSFQYERIDISNWAGNHEFRLRFVGVGANQGYFPLWFIDNIFIYTPDDELIPEAPISLTAHQSENNWVYLNWADYNETAQLSYLEKTESNEAIGNLGLPFIAANRFSSQDLSSYEGYYLTSISVAIVNREPVTPPCTLYVSQGGERKVSQVITQFTPQSWNTFELETPYLIDPSQSLYYGIEIGRHATNDLIIGLCEAVIAEGRDEPIFIYHGRANLFSEDNGRTWRRVSDETEYIGSWGITGELKKNILTEKDERILGYKIYRNGVSLLGNEGGSDILTIVNNYTDYNPINATACYEISAYYDTQQESPRSQSVCILTTDIDENEIPGSLSVYPNPVYDHINITGSFKDATLFDLQGNMILNSNEPQINVNGITSGIYFLRINLVDGGNVTWKIIKM